MGNALRGTLSNIILYSILYIALLYCFIFTIVPYFSWFFTDLNLTKIIFGFIITILVAALLPYQFLKPSSMFLHLQFILPILPMLVMYGASNLSTNYIILVILAFMLILLIKNLSIKPIFFTNISIDFLIYIFLFLSFSAISLEYISRGSFNLDITKIYDVRLMNEQANTNSLILYFSSFASNVFLPFALILSVRNKSISAACISILGSLLIFGITNSKSAIFYPFMALFIYFFLSQEKPIKVLLVSSIFLVIFSIITFQEGDLYRIAITALGVRRVFFEPSLINFYYYEFFSNNQLVFWSNSKLTFGLFDYPYHLDPAHLIGENYYGTSLNGANTGWLGSGIMQGGTFGLFLYASLVGLILSYLDSCKVFLSSKLVVSLTICPMFVMFLSSDLLSSLLTHGVLLSIILLSFVSVDNKSKQNA